MDICDLCGDLATVVVDSAEPGGSIHLCAAHAPEPCTMLRGDPPTPCGAPSVSATKSRDQICHFCADCATWAS